MIRHGDIRLPERFWSKLCVEHNGCWLWKGAKIKDGYGGFWWRGRWRQAHRVAYQELVESIRPGLQLDHFVCNIPSCVNPAHLRPVTSRENVLRGDTIVSMNLARTHCRREGHLLDAPNLTARKDGSRGCRACQRENNNRHRSKFMESA